MMGHEKCIYCSSMVDTSKSEGDHIIPAALGEFRNDVRFDRICVQCNNSIGKSESQLLRCGPERLCRHIVLGSRARSPNRKTSWSVGAEGMSPPKVVVYHSGSQLLAEHRPESNAFEIVDQLIITDESSTPRYIRLFPNMSAKSLRRCYEALQLRGKLTIQLNGDEQYYEKYIRLIDEALSTKLKSDSSISAGLHQGIMRFEFQVNDHYFRAIAKMALHYYLTYSVRYKGYEKLFDPIKNFIRTGGNVDLFFNVPKIFTTTEEMLSKSIVSSRWVHFLGVCEHNGAIIGYVRLFYGPRSRGIEYHVRLGDLASNIVLPTPVWGHAYAYDNSVSDSGEVGEVQRVSIGRLR